MDPPLAPGLLAEERARFLVARLGLADFVYACPVVPRGKGAGRELADGLILCGESGALLQVKSRHPDASANDTSDKAERWIRKHAAVAKGQGKGGRRALAEWGGELTAVPLRALAVPELGEAYALRLSVDASAWPVICVIDHPLADGVWVPWDADTFFITLDDWEELNRAIRSVRGLLEYVSRVLASGPGTHSPLGHERDRYGRVVEADQRHAALGGKRRVPVFSWETVEDPLGAELYRRLLEYVWPTDLTQNLPPAAPSDVRAMLEILDSVPPSIQARIGRWILGKRRRVRDAGTRSSGAFLTGQDLVVVFCDSEANWTDIEDFQQQLMALGAFRAEEVFEQSGMRVRTVAIGCLDNPVDGDYYQFAMLAPDADFALRDEARRALEAEFGCLDLKAGAVRRIAPGRNDPCSCGSGRKYKRCCLD